MVRLRTGEFGGQLIYGGFTGFIALNRLQLPCITFSKRRVFSRCNPINEKPSRALGGLSNWVQGLDLNQRPSG